MTPRTNPRHEPDRVYERAADPAEAVNRPLEPKSLPAEQAAAQADEGEARDPHHRLNTPVGEPSPDADSDPYRPATSEDDADRASGTTGAHRGAEDRA